MSVLGPEELEAASIKVGISNYVGSATLAVIGGAIAVFTYVQANFSVTPQFYWLFGAAVASSVLSLIVGGRAANTTAEAVATKSWKNATSKSMYNFQAISSLLGLGLLVVATLIGTTAPPIVHKDPCLVLVSGELARPSPDTHQVSVDLAACERAGQ
jgi:hypothetical protein